MTSKQGVEWRTEYTECGVQGIRQGQKEKPVNPHCVGGPWAETG